MEQERVGEYKLQPIAYIHTDFQEKFGIPRQSGIVKELQAQIVFTPEYRNPEALRGIEMFSHLWLIWQFSEVANRQQNGERWHATVRPPRLGGNTRLGVFATRSPFRPNAIGLSCVELERLEQTEEGTVLWVRGADLLDGTPIYDIKPYLPYSDSRPEAKEGFTENTKEYSLFVECPEELLQRLPEEKRASLLGVLAHDPRPSYQNDPERLYGMSFAGFTVKFKVQETNLQVILIEKEA